MSNRPTLTGIAFFLTSLACLSSLAAEDEAFRDWKHSTWRIRVSLETPSLVPPAVQWTVLDEDPVPAFMARVKKSQDRIQEQLDRTDDEFQKEIVQASQMTVHWDIGFRGVTGDKVYLLTAAPGVTHSLSSNSQTGKKWIVTKTVSIKGKPICWCIPIEVNRGEELEVEVTEKNVYDLQTVYAKAMQGSDKEE